MTYHEHAHTETHQRRRIRHRRTTAYPPGTHGVVECTGGTITAETVYRWHFNSPAIWAAASYGFDALSPATGRIVYTLMTVDS
ncbi:MAG: hypothetical protein ACREJN_08470 [Nitrospiraceae bacterium]